MVDKIPEWTYKKEYPGLYNPPAVPEYYNNEPWSTFSLYKKFGLEKDYGLGRNLVYKYFDHNYPLALWLPDGTVVKAKSAGEFTELIRFTTENQAHLPGWLNIPPYKRVITFDDFKQEIDKVRSSTG